MGRVRRGGPVLPLVLPLLRAERGIVVDAVLLYPERGQHRIRVQLVVFPGGRAAARELVEFLGSIMPLKRVDEL